MSLFIVSRLGRTIYRTLLLETYKFNQNFFEFVVVVIVEKNHNMD